MKDRQSYMSYIFVAYLTIASIARMLVQEFLMQEYLMQESPPLKPDRCDDIKLLSIRYG